MFTVKLKQDISDAIQKILQETNHYELPKGEIKFLLHVDGADNWSWANILNNNSAVFSDVPKVPVPPILKRNTTFMPKNK